MRESSFAKESAAALPPAAVLTVEYDPLRDEGRAYAAKLREAGVVVEELHLMDQIHGFLRHTNVFPQSRETIQKLGGILRRVLSAAIISCPR